jgi:hypothetical protein
MTSFDSNGGLKECKHRKKRMHTTFHLESLIGGVDLKLETRKDVETLATREFSKASSVV